MQKRVKEILVYHKREIQSISCCIKPALPTRTPFYHRKSPLANFWHIHTMRLRQIIFTEKWKSSKAQSAVDLLCAAHSFSICSECLKEDHQWTSMSLFYFKNWHVKWESSPEKVIYGHKMYFFSPQIGTSLKAFRDCTPFRRGRSLCSNCITALSIFATSLLASWQPVSWGKSLENAYKQNSKLEAIYCPDWPVTFPWFFHIFQSANE